MKTKTEGNETTGPGEFITASEIEKGEAGYGLTVLEGNTIIRFPVTFIGGLEKAMVNQDIVLIRLEGDPFQKSGIIQGMSGSPIYFKGRLLGALAYGWSFSKEPIAGVTPIANMLTLIDEQSAEIAPPAGFVPVNAPLSVAGLSPMRTGEAWRRIDGLGFNSAAGGRLNGTPARLEPGSPIGVRLVDGDLSLTAIGTVTYVKDSAVIGFGHPFLNRGLSHLPMTGARIETILPSTEISFKLGSSTDDAGSILRDGSAGISGMFGESPEMIPFNVSLTAPWGRHDYSFRICRDDALTPQLMDIAWASAAEAGLFTAGSAGIEVEVNVTSSGHTATLRERGVANQSILEMMPTLPIKLLYDNPFGRVHPDSVSINVRVTDDRRINEIVGFRPAQTVLVPGETLGVDVIFQTYDVGRNIRHFEIPIPEGLPEGPVSISISGGRGLNQPEIAEPRDIGSLMAALNAYEPRNTLVFRISAGGGSQLEIEGGILPALPPSVRKIQTGASRSGSGVSFEFPMDAPIIGRRSANMEVRRD